MPLLPLAATFLIALLASLALSALAVRLGVRLGIADAPGGRRKHPRITSRLGVLPLFGAFVLSAMVSRLFFVPTRDGNEQTRFAGLMLGGVIAFVVAILDDKFELPSGPQFAGQAIAAFVAIGSLIFIERFRNPFSNSEQLLPFTVTVAVTLFWFIGMMNTVNFLDGVDGLAASVSLVATVLTLIHMLREGQYSVALIPMALIGTLLGFLAFNFQPARLFLGGGAIYLGFVLACIGIVAGAKIALLLLVMGLPIADVAWQMFDRARRGRSPTSGDRGHLHLRLADAGWSPRRIVAAYASVCIVFGGVALISQPPLFKLITLGALFLAVIVVLLRLSRRGSFDVESLP